MRRIKLNFKKRLEQIKVWQEECKLLLMILGAISATAVFVRNLFMGKVESSGLSDVLPLDVLKSIGTGGGESPLSLPPLSAYIPTAHSHHMFMYINVIVIVLLVGFAIYYLIKVFKKRRGHKS